MSENVEITKIKAEIYDMIVQQNILQNNIRQLSTIIQERENKLKELLDEADTKN